MLTRFLLFLADHLAAVLLLTAAGLLLAGVLLFRQLRRGRRAARPTPGPGPPAGDGTPEVEILPPSPLPRPRQIRRAMASGFATLRERVTNRTLRYRTPCVLLLGPAEAGKSTLLRELGPEAVSPGADDAGSAGCRWHFFARGVAIEVDGRLLVSDEHAEASAQGWDALLRALRHHRPERPVDGVVLTVPASDLMGPRRLDPETLAARARGVAVRLRDAQRVLGVRVPLYLIVTKCDRVRGFQALCTALPEAKRGECFGWSNPYAVDAAFVPGWIDEAFDSLASDLFEVQAELLERGAAERPEEVFRFSAALRGMRDPLRTFTEEVCRESAYQESFFFRGVYFTGDGTPDAAERLVDSAYLEEGGTASAHQPPALPALPSSLAVSRAPVFLDDLFHGKIFGEVGLARPVSGSRLSRNRTILGLQAAMLALVVIGGLGLWRANVVLERESGLLLSVLGDIEQDLRLLDDRSAIREAAGSGVSPATLDNRVFPLLSSMARVNENRLASVFIPSSWASSLHWDISESMRQGFTNVILPSMYSAILAKADSIVSPPASAAPAREALDGDALPRYLSAVARLGRNLERYDTISFIGAEDTELQNVAALVQYLFDEQLPPEFLGNQRYHRIALWESYGQRITPRDRPRYNERVVERAETLLRAYYDTLIERLEDVSTRFQSAEAVDRLTAADLADFRRLRGELTAVAGVLEGSETFWFDESEPVGASLLDVLDSIPVTPITDPHRIERDFAEMFRRVRSEKLRELNFRLDPFQEAGPSLSIGGTEDDGQTMALSPRLDALQASLDSLFAQPFLSAPELAPAYTAYASELPDGARMQWDVAALDRALREHAQYEEFVTRGRDGRSLGAGRLIEGLATVQLEARLASALRAAMVPEPPTYAYGLRDRERDLRERVAAFHEPSRRLVQILAVADRLGMTELYEELASTYLRQALGMLAEVDALLEESGLYRPVGGSLEGWDGLRPPAQIAFRARDAEELERYLAEQRARVRYLVDTFAAPLLGGLTSDAVAPFLAAGSGGSALVDRWAGLVDELDRHAARSGISSVEVLERFVREDLMATDLLVCVRNSDSPATPGRDFFLLARNRLRALLYSRCEELVVERARSGYLRAQSHFESRLAGRYPFSRGPAGATPDADPQAIRDFFALFDALGPYRHALGGEAATFVERMGGVRAFLAPLLDPEAVPGAPLFDVGVELRANRAAERGGDQIVELELELGETPVTSRGADEAPATGWRPGSPASLTLRWALQSGERPLAGGGAAVRGRDAVFRYGGRWGLLRLLQAHRAPDEAAGTLLRFDVPTERQVGEAGAAPGEGARVFVRLRLRHPGGGEAPPLPVFPVLAPAR